MWHLYLQNNFQSDFIQLQKCKCTMKMIFENDDDYDDGLDCGNDVTLEI